MIYYLFFQPRGDFGSNVNLGENNNMINELIIKWRVFDSLACTEAFHFAGKSIKIVVSEN